MKKLTLGLLASFAIIACTNTEKKSTETVEAAPAKLEHIYKPIYTDNFKIGGESNVLLAEQFHKVLFEKDFVKAGELLSDTVTFNNEDGSTLKGKAAVVEYMQKNFTGLTFKNYQIAAIIPVVGENGHQWVDLWDEAEITTPDGKSQKAQWSDAFRFENGKIVQFVGYGKVLK